MTKEEVLKSIVDTAKGSIVLDNIEYNPIEIIVLVEDIPVLFREKATGIYRIHDCNRERMLVCRTFRNMGLSEWYRKKKTNGLYLNEADYRFLWLVYCYACMDRDNWLKFNIFSKIERDMGLQEQEIHAFFCKYVKEMRIKLCVIRSSFISNEEKRCFTLFSIISMMITKKLAIKKMKCYYIKKYKAIRRKNLYSEKDFIRCLKEDGALEGDWDNIAGNSLSSSSGGTFIKSTVGDKQFFFKGNEPEPLTSVLNEIQVQRRIIDNDKDNDCFIKMEEYSETHRWIKYPFLPYKTLDQYLKEHELSREELKRFGVYLCNCLDSLYRLRIIHNDFRDTNIMVVVDEKDNPIDYRLIDFGAASIDGESPWNTNCYEGEYTIKSVCGDNRYNEAIIDDAASALLVYYEAGGNETDDIALSIREKIGRNYYSIYEKGF